MEELNEQTIEHSDDQTPISIPYFIHEGQMARMERVIRILTVTLALLMVATVLMFVGNNYLWMHYTDSQIREARMGVSHDARVQQQLDESLDK